MARSRNIKPGFFTNEDLGELDPLARLLFAGLWCHADREGRLEDRLKRLKPQILPFDNCDIEQLAQCLHGAGFIIRYVFDNKRYIQIKEFNKHQNPHIKEASSTIPAPCETDINTSGAGLIPDSFNPITDSLNPIKAAAHAQEPINGKSSAVDLAVALRSKGVKVNAAHPDVIQLADKGISKSTALEAVRIAQQERGKDNPSIKYLIPIINELITPKKMSSTMSAIMKLEEMKNGH